MSFTLFVNSLNGTQVQGANSTNEVNYKFDFESASKHTGKFKMTYSFLSEGGMTLDATDILEIRTTLSSSMNNFQAGNISGAQVSQTLGWVSNDRFNTTDCYYYKYAKESSPIILQCLPKLQDFTVYLTNAFTGVLEPHLGNKDYSLVLYFEAIE